MDRYQTTINTFDSIAELYLKKFKDFTPYQASYDWFLQSLKPNQTQVLEVACGPGQVSHYLLKQQPELDILGIDLAPNMIKLAKNLNPQAQYRVMDCRQISQLEARFDAIMCGFCLPYLSQQDAMQLIQDMAERLKPDGLLYLSTTSGAASQSGYQYSKSAAGAVYVTYHAISDISEQLKRSGLRQVQHKTINHTHNGQATTDEVILAKKQA